MNICIILYAKMEHKLIIDFDGLLNSVLMLTLGSSLK